MTKIPDGDHSLTIFFSPLWKALARYLTSKCEKCGQERLLSVFDAYSASRHFLCVRAHISPVYLWTRTFPMESIPCLTFSFFLFFNVLLHFCPVVSPIFGILSWILPQVPVECPLCHGAFHQFSAIQTFLGNGVTFRKFFQESKHCASRAVFFGHFHWCVGVCLVFPVFFWGHCEEEDKE